MSISIIYLSYLHIYIIESALYPGHPPWRCGTAAPEPDLPHRPPHQVQEHQADQRGWTSGRYPRK